MPPDNFAMPAKAYLSRSCPTCASEESDTSWRVESDPAAENVSLAELENSWRGFFKESKLFFTYRRCRSCGQVYAPIYFTPAQLAGLYRQMDDNTAGVSADLLARTQRGYWRLLRSCGEIPADGGYLELGPDIGLFTREAMASTTFVPYWMIEPNLAVHSTLAELLRGKEHRLLADSAEIDSLPDESVSLAVAIHVLDHLLEPGRLLEQLRRKLRPGGVIFLVLHNQQSWMAQVFRRRWPPYCLQHPQLFAPGSVEEILRQAGFQQVQVRATTNYFPVMYLLRHLLFGLGLGRVPLPALTSLSLGLKLGNIAVVARKG